MKKKTSCCSENLNFRFIKVFLPVNPCSGFAGLMAIMVLVGSSYLFGEGAEKQTVEVSLAPTTGRSPTIPATKPGWSFPLSAIAPATVKTPPSGDGLLYGEIPLVGKPVLFAILPSSQPDSPCTFFVDKNGDGDFSNDDSSQYRGEGTSGSAANLNLQVSRPDGTTFPHKIWLYTTVSRPEVEKGFQFYTRSFKEGKFPVSIDNVQRTFRITAGDSGNPPEDVGNIGAYDSGKIWIDWNDNGKAEEPECLKEKEVCKYADKLIRLVKIAPFADKVTLEILPASKAGANKDVRDLLAEEPIEGNLPPKLGVDLEGKDVRLEDYRGKLVLIDFWATWCGPCMKELPKIKAAYDKYHEKGLEIIGVSLDKNSDQLRDFLNREKIPWRQICDEKEWDSAIVKKWRVTGIPSMYLIGRDGKIAPEYWEKAIERELSTKAQEATDPYKKFSIDTTAKESDSTTLVSSVVRITTEWVDVDAAAAMQLMHDGMAPNNPEVIQKIRDLEAQNKATIVDAQSITTASGQRASSKGMKEFVYASKYESIPFPASNDKNKADASSGQGTVAVLAPTEEKHTVGGQLQAEPLAYQDGTLAISMAVVFTVFTGWQEIGRGIIISGNLGVASDHASPIAKKPIFATSELNTSLKMLSGQTLVAGMTTVQKEDGTIDFTKKRLLLINAVISQ